MLNSFLKSCQFHELTTAFVRNDKKNVFTWGKLESCCSSKMDLFNMFCHTQHPIPQVNDSHQCTAINKWNKQDKKYSQWTWMSSLLTFVGWKMCALYSWISAIRLIRFGCCEHGSEGSVRPLTRILVSHTKQKNNNNNTRDTASMSLAHTQPNGA